MATPTGHHGTGWTDSPWCWQNCSSKRWVMGAVETVGRSQCYPAPEEWDSWKPSPCHTTNRALLAERSGHMAARWKTCWQLGDRKMPWKQRADVWPWGRTTKLLLVWESASQKVRKLKSIKKILVQDDNQVWTEVTTKSWKRERLKNYLQAQQNASLHKLKSP